LLRIAVGDDLFGNIL